MESTRRRGNETMKSRWSKKLSQELSLTEKWAKAHEHVVKAKKRRDVARRCNDPNLAACELDLRKALVSYNKIVDEL
jgi:hypothetical protein